MNHMKFENPYNRNRQTEALKRFCKEFGLTFVENKDFAFLDATLRKDTKFIGQAEVKGVHSNYADKEYVVVSMRKLVDCQKEQIKNKKPVAIIWVITGSWAALPSRKKPITQVPITGPIGGSPGLLLIGIAG